MWALRFWGQRYWGARFWGKVGAAPPEPTDFHKYEVPQAGLNYTVPSSIEGSEAMPTGAFWNEDNPDRPWGPFDPDAKIVFPVTISGWMADLGTSYASHQVIAAAPLHYVSSVQASGVISIRMELADAAVYKGGTKYPFTLRVIGADGQQDDRTLWLKVKDR